MVQCSCTKFQSILVVNHCLVYVVLWIFFLISQLTVSIIDVNDNPPIFDPVDDMINIPEGIAGNSIITIVRATDPDEGINAEIRYRFVGTSIESMKSHTPVSLLIHVSCLFLAAQVFGIEQDGSIVVNGFINYEALLPPTYTLLVEAVNNQADIQLASAVELIINVLDINDNPPIFQAGFPLVYSIAEVSLYRSVCLCVSFDSSVGRAVDCRGVVIHRSLVQIRLEGILFFAVL